MGYDVRALEFARGRAIAREMNEANVVVTPFDHELVAAIIERPQAYFTLNVDREPAVNLEIASRAKRLMTLVMTLGSQVHFDGFTALERTARRFGTWDSMLLPDPNLPSDELNRAKYERPSAELMEEETGLFSGTKLDHVQVFPFGESLVPWIFGKISGTTHLLGARAIADLDFGNLLWDVDLPFEDIKGAVSERLAEMPFLEVRFNSTGRTVRMERWNPAFDVFEPHATQVNVGRWMGVDRIEVQLSRDPRPADEPLFYGFDRDARRWSSLPQSGRLWRVEATIGEGVDARELLDAVSMDLKITERSSKLRQGTDLFLRGASDLYDVKNDFQSLFGEELYPGKSVDLFATGAHARKVLNDVWHGLRGQVPTNVTTNGGGGGASSTTCSITSAPRLPGTFGMGPNAMMSSGLMAARVGSLIK